MLPPTAIRWPAGSSDSIHPGSLALACRLAHLSAIGSASRVLDAGSGRGASAVHLAKAIGCQVVGVTPEEGGVAAGYELARKQGVESQVTFIQGDIQEIKLEADSFHLVLMECMLSILPGKAAVVRRLHALLRPNG